MRTSAGAQKALETVIEIKADAEILDTLVERLIAGDEIKGARWIQLVFGRMCGNIDTLHEHAVDELFAAIHEEQKGGEGERDSGEELPF